MRTWPETWATALAMSGLTPAGDRSGIYPGKHLSVSDLRADLAIVGGGAAGLTAAIFAAESLRDAGVPRQVVVLDGASRLGAKILVSGGGRCNVTHDKVAPSDYHGPQPIIRNILRHFDERATVGWLASMGVALKREDTGKLFPVSDSARTVLDALLRRCGELEVRIHTATRVRQVRRDTSGFSLVTSRGVVVAPRLILATGGRSLPKTGSDGGGYDLARALGHTVTPTHPALVPLVLEDGFFHASLSGLSHEVELSTWVEGRRVDRRRGPLLWTHFGISGPVVMDASRFWVAARAEGRLAELRCALVFDSFDRVERALIDAARREGLRSVESLLGKWLPRRLAGVLAAHLGVTGPVAELPRDVRRRLVHALTALKVPVVRDRGWNYAEVTTGGVPLSEVDHRTMASRRVPGLHVVGEMLDCDGRIGGFNFQWAWATGYLAGRAAAASLLVPTAAMTLPPQAPAGE